MEGDSAPIAVIVGVVAGVVVVLGISAVGVWRMRRPGANKRPSTVVSDSPTANAPMQAATEVAMTQPVAPAPRYDTQTGQPIPKFDPYTGVQNW